MSDSDNNVSRKQFLGMLGGLIGTAAFSTLLPSGSLFTGSVAGNDSNYGNSAYGGKK